MEDILKKIVGNKKKEVEEQKNLIPQSELSAKIKDFRNPASLKKSIESSESGIISEFKRRSPSKDWIHKDASVERTIPLYDRNGASGISILTDYLFFGGSSEDLQKARKLTKIPLLRKEFIIDEYQILQSKVLGANAILLIAAVLTNRKIKDFSSLAKELGLDNLLEIHNERELDAINENIDIVGVNNRNLKNFVIDLDTSFSLAKKIPAEFTKISESGISDTKTIRELKSAGYKGFLMGEKFMKESDPGEALKSFISSL